MRVGEVGRAAGRLPPRCARHHAPRFLTLERLPWPSYVGGGSDQLRWVVDSGFRALILAGSGVSCGGGSRLALGNRFHGDRDDCL
jgi:hypothetical protein